jgi:hypothetical protein
VLCTVSVCLCSSGGADDVHVQHSERHVLAGSRGLRDIQPRTAAHPSQSQWLHLHEAAGSGEYTRLYLSLMSFWLGLYPVPPMYSINGKLGVSWLHSAGRRHKLTIIILIIIFINCNWVVTRWQWLFNTNTKHELTSQLMCVSS